MREYVVQLEAVVPGLAATSVEDRQGRTDALLDTLETVAVVSHAGSHSSCKRTKAMGEKAVARGAARPDHRPLTAVATRDGAREFRVILEDVRDVKPDRPQSRLPALVLLSGR